MKRLLLLVALAGMANPAAEALGRRPHAPVLRLPQQEICVLTSLGPHRFRVWIAADDASRERGLMFVRNLPRDQGMLFLFERPQLASFWMKNTYVSLDLAFIGADGVVVNVAHDAVPLSEQAIRSAAPVKAVLELVAGSAERIGLRAGDRVQLPSGPVLGCHAVRRQGKL